MSVSIRRNLFVSISAFILIFVLLAFGGFSLFMPDFVERAKRIEMEKVSHYILQEEDEVQVSKYIEALLSSSDMSVIVNYQSSNVLSTFHGRGHRQGKGDDVKNMLRPASVGEGAFFYETQHNVLNTPFLIHVNSNDDKSVYIMRPLASIDAVVDVANGFFLIIALLAVGLGLIFSWFYARAFTKPILELNRIARYMAELDFTHKYDGHSRNEIGQLGKSINHLCNSLNTALNDLEEELKYKTKLNTLQKRFLADASHELKTPLTVIMGNLEQFVEPDGRAQLNKENTTAMIREIEHMDHVIQDLLQLSELESEEKKLTKTNLDLASVFDDVLFSYSELIKHYELEFEYDLEDSIPIYADENLMNTVVRNILNNAIHHSSVGAKVILRSQITPQMTTITLFNESKPIPESALENLFDRFKKVLSVEESQEHIKKTGLGLAIVKRILDLHQYKYHIENVEGGVEFSLIIPAPNVHTPGV